MPGKGKDKRRQTKDRVLQARIPEQLDDELRDRAEQLGLSVSTVVRNVLFNTFNLVEGVVSDSADIARVITGQEVSSPAPEAAQAPVLAWQEAVLNQNGVCDQCNAILPRGERGAVGVPVSARPVFLCVDCLAVLSNVAGESAAGQGED